MRRRGLEADDLDLWLTPAERVVLLTGELPPPGTPGRVAAYRLMFPTGERLIRLRTLWARVGPALSGQWRNEGHESAPWAATVLDEIDAPDDDEHGA